MNNKRAKAQLQKLQRQIVPSLRRNDVIKAGLFGSFVRGEAKRNSDVDILIKFRGTKSLLDLAGLEIELEKKLKRKVDILTYDSIHPLLKKRILDEEVKIL
ncbi:nucleotidyltransferase family protein [Candidatus Woesearchaeota archaeon]|nr:nucleotidyltransferase family protein [Candidatus Woesearchaeota archaeon]